MTGQATPFQRREAAQRFLAIATQTVIKRHGDQRTLLGPELWRALVAYELLACIAGQDSEVADSTVRGLAEAVWGLLNAEAPPNALLCGVCRHPARLHREGGVTGPCRARGCRRGPQGAPCPGFAPAEVPA